MINFKNVSAAALVTGGMLFGGIAKATSASAATGSDCGPVSVSSTATVNCSPVARPSVTANPFNSGLGAQGKGGKFAELKGRFGGATNWVKQQQQQWGGTIPR